MNVVMTSAKLASTVAQAMMEQVIKDGYGMRGKSRWITEAIENFLQLPDYRELVNIASEMEELDAVVSIRSPKELQNKIDKALVVVRIAYPKMEGVRSNIIRASILQRLIPT